MRDFLKQATISTRRMEDFVFRTAEDVIMALGITTTYILEICSYLQKAGLNVEVHCAQFSCQGRHR